MKGWRPEGFENPYTPDLEQTGEYLDHGARDQSIFEDGADAVLAASQRRQHQDWLATGANDFSFNPHMLGVGMSEWRPKDVTGVFRCRVTQVQRCKGGSTADPLIFEITAQSVVTQDGEVTTMSLPTIPAGKGTLVFIPDKE